jgi:hypothetical protein
MAIKPTKPTSPPQALRSNPENFSANAEGWIAYQSTTFPNYIDAVTDFVDGAADAALAAALGGDLPPLTGQAGKVLAVKGDESGAEFVDLPPDTIGALATNGLVARTGAGTAAARTLTAGTGITITDGDGVAGDPTVAASIATQAEAEAGTDNAKLMTPLRVAQAVAVAVGAGTAGLAYGAVGSYAWLVRDGLQVVAGSTYAGSVLKPGGVYANPAFADDSVGAANASALAKGSGTLAGTWRAMGSVTYLSTTSFARGTLFLRIS